MGNWNELLDEINQSHDFIRRKYLKAFSERTGRNVVSYYSGWLQKPGQKFFNLTSITDEDKSGFMSCFFGLDKSLGLDLFIHSPGGRVSSTESLIHYLRSVFDDNIRIFVPQLAMYGGTILALSGKEIWLGKHSNLGPIDPQFGNMPAVTLIEEFKRAYKEISKDSGMIHVWSPILRQISPTFLTQAKQAIDLSRTIAVNALVSGMFKGRADARRKAGAIARALTNVNTHKDHSRHIHMEDCEKLGLTIKRIEDDDEMQGAILSVHHAFMISLANTPAVKIIENHEGAAFVKNVQQNVLALSPT